MSQPVIIWAKCTPFGKYGGKLKHLEPEALLMPLFEEMNSTLPKVIPDIDDVVTGNIVGNGGNIARKALLEAGLTESTPGVTMDRQCGSGLESIIYACRMVQAGAGHIYIAGGVENTSRAPWEIKHPQSVYDAQLPGSYERASSVPKGQDPSMIEAAENAVQYYHITHKQQDALAIRNHHLTHQYHENGSMSNETVSSNIKDHLLDKGEGIKPTLAGQRLNQLRPLPVDGIVTAGNSCMKNDGAVLALAMNQETALQYGISEGMMFTDAVTIGVSPKRLGIGPVPVAIKLFKKQNSKVSDIDTIESNEAFSSQALASIQELKLNINRVNQWGGAIVSGHPYSTSDVALIARLLNMTHWKRGAATAGTGGGMGNAILFERWSL